MEDRVIDAAPACEGFAAGPLARHVTAFVEHLGGLGYAQATLREQRQAVDAFARWMGRRRLTVADLDERVVAAFVDARQPRWRAQRAGATLRRLLMYFRAQGVIGPLPAIVDDSLLTQLAGRYQHSLCAERGLAATSVQTYLGFFKQFLCERLDPAATSVTSLRAGDVAAFVRRHALRQSPHDVVAAIARPVAWLSTPTVGRRFTCSEASPMRASQHPRSHPRISTRDWASTTLDYRRTQLTQSRGK